MSDSSAYDECASLAEPIAAGVHAMYAEIGSRAGLGDLADAVASIPADFVGPQGGGWEAVCATMFDAPAAQESSAAAPAGGEGGGSAGHGDAAASSGTGASD